MLEHFDSLFVLLLTWRIIGLKVLERYNVYRSNNVYKITVMWWKPPNWAKPWEQVWTWAPHLQTQESSKLRHVFGYAPFKFCSGRIGCAPKGPTQASKSRPIITYFKHGVALCCWAEPHLPTFFCSLGKNSTAISKQSCETVSEGLASRTFSNLKRFCQTPPPPLQSLWLTPLHFLTVSDRFANIDISHFHLFYARS